MYSIVKVVAFVSFAIYSVQGLEQHSQCGIKGKGSQLLNRIVGGQKAYQGEFPWQVALTIMTWNGYAQYCGGTLINNQWVLTAAHCVDGMIANYLMVRVGEYRLSVEDKGEESIATSKFIMHPLYSKKTMKNDIALIKLDKVLNYQKEHSHLAPICLDSGLKSFKNCTATGWGYLSFNGASPDTLQKVPVPLVPDSVCQKMFIRFNLNINMMLCAGSYKERQGVCQGDSGGPLQCKQKDGSYAQVGITSWGYKCAEPGIPAVYTRVSNYLSWISEIIEAN